MIKILVFKKFNSIICLFNNLFCICGIGNIYLKKKRTEISITFFFGRTTTEDEINWREYSVFKWISNIVFSKCIQAHM